MKYSAVLLQFLGSKNTLEAGIEGGPRADRASGLWDLRGRWEPAERRPGCEGRAAPRAPARPNPLQPPPSAHGGPVVNPAPVLPAPRCLGRLSGAAVPPPRAARTGDSDSDSGSGLRAGHGRVPSLVGLGRRGLEQRSPEGAQPPRRAGTGAWQPHQPRGAAPAPPLGARAHHPISASGVPKVPPLHPERPISAPQGECSALRPPPPPLRLIQARCSGNPRIRS